MTDKRRNSQGRIDPLYYRIYGDCKMNGDLYELPQSYKTAPRISKERRTSYSEIEDPWQLSITREKPQVRKLKIDSGLNKY